MRESLPAEERQALLEEVRSHLPAFLHRSATEQQDPAGDVRALLDLEQADLDRVVAVHRCLNPAVLAFGHALETGLAHPLTGNTPVAVVRQSVRGRIDWQGTIRHRARAPGDLAHYSVRETGTALDTAESRALVWLLDALEKAVDQAITWNTKSKSEWSRKIETLRDQLTASRRVKWLQGLPAAKPTAAVVRSLRSARRGFYAEQLPAAIEAVLRLGEGSAEALTAALSERYFRPGDDGTLFELVVALRLAGALRELSVGKVRRTRLLVGEGKSSFARYRFDDGGEVVLVYQAWPDDEHSMRRRLVERHRLSKGPSEARPDIMIVRRNSEAEATDVVILELKASHKSEYLRKGLEELLAYLADRPGLWGAQPAGWLVAPSSAAFEEGDADPDFPLWVLSADRVSAAATARFAGS